LKNGEGKCSGVGTKEQPWVLKPQAGRRVYDVSRRVGKPATLVYLVGKTDTLPNRCLEDLHAMLKAHGD
jgi:hypothetical protein